MATQIFKKGTVIKVLTGKQKGLCFPLKEDMIVMNFDVKYSKKFLKGLLK